MSSSPSKPSSIAIIGVSALFPGSQDAEGFWRDILAGRDLLTDVPSGHWLIDDYYDADPSAPDKTYARRGGFLDKVDFDALAFGIPPSTVPATDTSQLLALIVAQAVLQDALGAQFDSADRSRTSVILGVTSAQELLFSMVSRLQRPVWVKALRESGLPEDEVQAACDRIAAEYVPWQESSFPGLLGNVVAGRIANRLNLGGTNCVTDAACASSFSALSMAVNELQLGHSDLVISGGVDTLNDIFMYMCFSKTPALSPSGDCRPFSDQADGTMLGEGLGMVALKRLEDAERDGDRIYAVIRGIGTSSDGRAKSVYAPVPEGQAKALRRAYEQAGYGPESVELMEAHGTGTKAGDAAEFEGLRQVFAPADPQRRQWCALGSVKSQVGHTKAAAGAAGLFKAVMALHHKVLPPTIKIAAPNPKLQLEASPFHLNTRARPWIRDAAHPRRASVSAFGFGGSNFHVALEEYVGPGARPPRLIGRRHDLLALAAASSEALLEQARQLRVSERPLAALCAESRAGWDAAAPVRLALVVDSREGLHGRLDAAIRRIQSTPEQAFSLPDGNSYGCHVAEGKLALLFPGQGSQYLGMGADLAMHLPVAGAVWDQAASLFGERVRLHEVVFPIPKFSAEDEARDRARLTATEIAQPAIGCVSLALLAVLRQLGVEGELCAGHSFGELTALFAAGAFDAQGFLQAARRRGETMRDAAATPGAMLALALPIERVRELLAGHDLVVANHNAPNQVIVSGRLDAIAGFEAALAAAGIAARRLPVASAFHSDVVAPACAPFAAFLDDLPVQAPQRPVYANAAAELYPSDARAVRAGLAAQLAQPVRFVECIEAMYAAGARTFVEVGPAAVLSGLVDAILGERPHLAVALDRKDRDGIESLLIGLSRLAAAGVPMALDRLFAADKVSMQAPKPAGLALSINGSNYGKPYPPADPSRLPAPNPPRSVPAAGHAESSSASTRTSPNEPVSFPTSIPMSTPVSMPMNGQSNPSMTAGASTAIAPARSAHSVPATEVSTAWLQAFQEQQQQTAAAHAAFQRAMFDSHTAYLQLAEAALHSLGSVSAQGHLTAPAAPAREQYVPMPASSPAQPLPVAPVQPSAPNSVAVATAPAAATLPVTAGVSVAVTPPAHVSKVDLQALMLDVVAEKTGYPVDMLRLDMDLEGDLGIDSIKRVEILAAIDERAPDRPKVDRAALSALHTLGEIADYLQAAAGAVQTSNAPTAGMAMMPVEAVRPSTSVDLQALMLEVVAEKTGYPADMLRLDMDLEGDLGIDSIKRVEILAAIDERAPDRPKVDRAALSALHTLGEIVAFLQSAQASTVPAKAPVAVPAGTDFANLMLEVVAEKTGYPVDMLKLEMDLEGDLGIDSIKRVEILAAIDERAPDHPKVERAQLAALHTLGEIVECLRGAAATPVATSSEANRSVAAAPAPVCSAAPALGRYVLQWLDAPASGLSQAGLLGGARVWITGAPEFNAQLADALRGRGVNAQASEAVPASATACIYLGGLREPASVDEAMAINREAFVLARQLARQAEAQRVLFITVQDTGGDFGLGGTRPERAWLAGLPALIKTAALEWPKAALKAIDIDRGGRDDKTLMQALADELLLGGGELEIALSRDGARRTLLSAARVVEPADAVIEDGDVVLVSGGGRGVTGACLRAWAQQCKARFVLLGRTALQAEPAACKNAEGEAAVKAALLKGSAGKSKASTPAELQRRVDSILANREINATMAAVKPGGAEVRYESIDIVDRSALDKLLDKLRAEWGPIRGVVHAAGVLADKRIADKTDAQFDRVFDTKVGGLRALIEATAGDPLKLLAVFSSVSARCGNTGQADYAMANEVLAKVMHAEAARRPGLRVKSFGWGPWEGGMVGPQLKARFAELGVPMIPLEVGARMFVDELQDASGAVELVLGGEPRPEALLSDGAKARVHTLELHIDRDSHGFLEGHAVNGMPVVPVVLVAEWLSRAARSVRPGQTLAALHDFKVLKGIRLGGFEGDGDRFLIEVTPVFNAGGHVLQVVVKDAHGTAYYSARAEMQTGPMLEQHGMPELALESWSGEPLYQNLLFHRGKFELIESMQGISDHGVGATLRGVDEAGWTFQPWQLDVAALDAGLQMAVLYGQRMLGGPNLPTSIEVLRSYTDAPIRGPVTAQAYRRRVAASSITTDILFTDSAGRRFAELLGVQNHALPRA